MFSFKKTKKKIENKLSERVIFKIMDTKRDDNIFFVSSNKLLYEEFDFEIINIKENKSGIVKYARSLGMTMGKNLDAHFTLAENKKTKYRFNRNYLR